MSTGETMTIEQLDGELDAARRVLALARFRIRMDERIYGMPTRHAGYDYQGRLLAPHLGRDRDLWWRYQAILRRVRYLETMRPA